MIQYLNWLTELEGFEQVDCIENELLIFRYSELIKKIEHKSPFHHDTMRNPHKFDFFAFINHTSGSATIKVDMEEIVLEKPCNLVKLAAGRIFSVERVSPDFDASVMLMSKQFIEGLMVFVNGSVPFPMLLDEKVVEHYDTEAEYSHDLFQRIVSHCIQDKHNPYRLQVVQHVIMALFYSSKKIRETYTQEVYRSNADVLSKKFLDLAKENFRKERQLQFYADALCITPRYLSRVVKECTGSSAADWIERCVVLEARALLKSTNMTIQQISDVLNFPSQTFFGKYFKRRVGMSPKEYRRLG